MAAVFTSLRGLPKLSRAPSSFGSLANLHARGHCHISLRHDPACFALDQRQGSLLHLLRGRSRSQHVDARSVGDRQQLVSVFKRNFSSVSNNKESGSAQPDDDPDAFSPNRHTGIQMHPDSISRTILPGNFVKKTNRRSGVTRKRYTELVHGYFWMLRDLQQSDEKPVLSNTELIPEAGAKVFPALPNLRRLDSNESVDLPSYFLRKNRSRDAAAQCTVVGVSFRDYGYQLLKTWLDPLPAALLTSDEAGSSLPSPNRVEVVRLSINEGWVNSWVLRGLIRTLARRNTPTEEQAQTLQYFGKDLELFRDALRMHNIMTGYVFLLDGLGRVRFAGSGRASDEEVARLLRFAADLTRQPRSPPQKNRQRKHR